MSIKANYGKLTQIGSSRLVDEKGFHNITLKILDSGIEMGDWRLFAQQANPLAADFGTYLHLWKGQKLV